MWCWRRLLRVPWTARRLNQSILREINHEYSLGLMLKLKFQYFGHLKQTDDSLEKSLMLGKTECRRRRHQEDEMARQYHRCNEHELWANSRRWWGTGRPGALQSTGSQRVGHDWAINNNPHTLNFQFAPYFIKRQNKCNCYKKEIWNLAAWIQIPALPLTKLCKIGQLIYHFITQFSHLSNRNNNNGNQFLKSL